MDDLKITGAGKVEGGIYVELSDGSSLIFSLEQLLSLKPEEVAKREDPEP